MGVLCQRHGISEALACLEIEVWNFRNQFAADLCHFKASNVSSVYASQVFFLCIVELNRHA